MSVLGNAVLRRHLVASTWEGEHPKWVTVVDGALGRCDADTFAGRTPPTCRVNAFQWVQSDRFLLSVQPVIRLREGGKTRDWNYCVWRCLSVPLEMSALRTNKNDRDVRDMRRSMSKQRENRVNGHLGLSINGNELMHIIYKYTCSLTVTFNPHLNYFHNNMPQKLRLV